jgi:hypothetical protein
MKVIEDFANRLEFEFLCGEQWLRECGATDAEVADVLRWQLEELRQRAAELRVSLLAFEDIRG